MRLGMVGLGRMGGNMVLRLMRGGHETAVYDSDREKVKLLVERGAMGAASLEELVEKLDKPRVVWVMVPAGPPTEEVVYGLSRSMDSGDIIIEGGNSHYRDDFRHADDLKKMGIHYVDVGVSGGIWGLENGYSIMVGGDEKTVEHLRPIFESLAQSPERGWGHVGPTGAGHYVKIIHNGMIYGLLQAYAEGFELLHNKSEFDLDLARIAEIWRYSSVARSWLLDLIHSSLEEDADLENVAAHINDSGEGRWAVQEAIDQNCSAPVIALSLLRRIRSREDGPYSDKLIARLRNLFGGHDLPETGD